MPGSSLWIVPPVSCQLYQKLSRLISETVPSHFPSIERPINFAPHVTLVSGLRLPEDPQQWLDNLELPSAKDVVVKFKALDIGSEFVKKITIKVGKEGVQQLAIKCRAEGVEGGDMDRAKKWVAESYNNPHLSLLYADIDVSDEVKAAVLDDLEAAGIALSEKGPLAGWEGGVVWLVPTFKNFEEWNPVAQRKL